MGACIHGEDSLTTGTLGGFVPIDENRVGFLTCAHVVGSDVGNLVSVVETGNLSRRYALFRIPKFS